MPKYPAPPNIAALLRPTAPDKPRSHELARAFRAAILAGQLAPGTRLPATRELAVTLGIARTTVVNVFEQLQAEGYVTSRVGDGTYVTSTLAATRPAIVPTEQRPQTGRSPSRRGLIIAGTPLMTTPDTAPRPFRSGVPALDAFPFDVWSRLTHRWVRQPPPALLSYADPAGYRPLREAIAAYLVASRGVRCTADQVLVVAGSQQAIDLAARVLIDPGDAVWVEDPSYLAGRGALAAAGATLVPVPLDREGLDVVAGKAQNPTARMAYVTPSHQYPLGVTMSLSRRQALLAWAAQGGAWVLEDDYDSEYRYAGPPLGALQGLDTSDRVIYIGTFSKVLFPALRLGYMVVPPDLVGVFTQARAFSDRCAPGLEQAVVTDFLADGHFARHIRRMRALYRSRQETLVAAVRRWLGGLLSVEPSDAGMHVVGWLPPGEDAIAVARRAREVEVEVAMLSTFALNTTVLPGLVMGYTATPAEEIERAVRRLATVLKA
jgi:GntR family transcriptional regulator / MocR family aminotransferase